MKWKQGSVHTLGLFPAFGPRHLGGVQLSGEIAWEGLRAAGGEALLLAFGAAPDEGTPDILPLPSKSAAIRTALDRSWRAERVLVWHIGLLKLLPFFRLGRTKRYLYLHGIEIWRPLDPLSRWLLRRVDGFLSNSDYTWERFVALHPTLASRPHCTVPLGVGEPLDGPTAQPDARPAALVVSRLAREEDYKGHREMIAAWPRLLETIPNAELWIAGEGSLRPELAAMVAEAGLGHAIHFLGRISDEEREARLDRCRCLAMPSRNEGFGLVYLEAMRRGRPCLVSTLDAGREVVAPPEAGLAVEPTDTSALASAFVRLLSDGPEWAHWSRQSRARYEAHFTAAHFQRRLFAALDGEGGS